jgi:hypothetical protein
MGGPQLRLRETGRFACPRCEQLAGLTLLDKMLPCARRRAPRAFRSCLSIVGFREAWSAAGGRSRGQRTRIARGVGGEPLSQPISKMYEHQRLSGDRRRPGHHAAARRRHGARAAFGTPSSPDRPAYISIDRRPALLGGSSSDQRVNPPIAASRQTGDDLFDLGELFRIWL